MDNILEIRNLRKNYKGFELKDISFNLEKGYIMGFIGPNGAGKSTTIKLIMNLIKRDGGEIKVFGKDNIEDEIYIKNKIGFVYDENYYYEDLKVDEVRRVVAPFYTKWDDSLFYKNLKKFEIPKDKKIKDLSKGMKMKFSLAAALSHDAEFIIMDEPTSGLDPIFRSEILDILYDVIQDENKAIFFSTHITSDLDRIADYITFINDGKIIMSCPKDEIMENYAVVKGDVEALDSMTRKELIGIKESKYGFEALTKNIDKIRSIFRGKAVIEKPTLEDIMLYTIRGKANV